jgi:hypothetical protein
MSPNEEKLSNFLKSLGYSAQLDEAPPPNPPGLKTVFAQHMGVNVSIWLDRDLILIITIVFGFLPKANTAPLMRRCLALNAKLIGVCIALAEGANPSLQLNGCRFMEGLDFVEFKALLDHSAMVYWQHVTPLINEFQIPMQPAQ